jgi:regulatory protein
MGARLDSEAAVRHVAMDLLARREHGRAELIAKLRRLGASDALIASVLARLSDEGLLSEARYLDNFIGYRARSGYGPQRIREELCQRGLDRADIEQALSVCGIDWSEGLQRVWLRKFSGKRPEDVRERGRQMRFLVYRGFSSEAVGRLLRGALDQD